MLGDLDTWLNVPVTIILQDGKDYRGQPKITKHNTKCFLADSNEQVINTEGVTITCSAQIFLHERELPYVTSTSNNATVSVQLPNGTYIVQSLKYDYDDKGKLQCIRFLC